MLAPVNPRGDLDMAMILSFIPRKATNSGVPGPLAKAGDVIIFPGVRYEQAYMVQPIGDDRGPDAAHQVTDEPGKSHH